MLFRLEPTPFHKGEKPIAGKFKFIETLAVLPLCVEPDGTIRNLLLCRTDTGLQRIEERAVWEAVRVGQYREARRSREKAARG